MAGAAIQPRGAPPAGRRFPRRADDCARPQGLREPPSSLLRYCPDYRRGTRERQAKEGPMHTRTIWLCRPRWRHGPRPAGDYPRLRLVLQRRCAGLAHGRRRAMAIAPTLPQHGRHPFLAEENCEPYHRLPAVTPPWTRQGGSCRRRGSSKRPSPAVVRPCSTRAASPTATIPPGRSPRAAGDCGQPTSGRHEYLWPHEY
jgi:hypothetical protein